MENCRVELTTWRWRQIPAEVKIQGSIYLGDSFSPLRFVIAVKPLKFVLQIYKITKQMM